MTNATTSESLSQDPISWAHSHFATRQVEMLEDYPWNKLYRLNGPTDIAYLKVLPASFNHSFAAVELISRHFEGVVPAVAAIDQRQNAILLHRADGKALNTAISLKQFRALLSAYARIQAKSTSIDELLGELPRLDTSTLVEELLTFLNPERPATAEGIGVEFFVGEPDARKFHHAINNRRDLLERLIATTSQLPPTLNHGNLTPQCAAETDTGDIIIQDWDDAVIGPAGLSLHLLFNGSANLYRLLNEPDLNENDPSNPHVGLIRYYIRELVNLGYSDHKHLESLLPAAAACGTLRSIIKYRSQLLDDLVYRKTIGELIRSRVTDLLDLTDLVALRSRQLVIKYAEDYFNLGEPARSENLLAMFRHDHPNDGEISYRLGNLYISTQQWEKAVEIAPSVIEHYPRDAVARNNLGYALMVTGHHLEAISEFDAALMLDPNYDKALHNRETATLLLRASEKARLPHVAPMITLQPDWSDYHHGDPSKIAFSTQMMREHGTLLVENAFPREHIEEMRKLVFSGKYDRYFVDKMHPDAMQTGDKRFMVTLDIEGPLSDPMLYRNQFLDGLMRRVLGDDYIIGALHVVLSLPGARDMRVHKDHPALFRDPGSPMVTLPFAVSMMVPLMDMTPELGTTRLMKGSHLFGDEAPSHLPVQDHYLQAGSCLLFDFRLTHQGLANRSNHIRPLFFITYYRPWFRDIVNFELQPSISLSQSEYSTMPEDMQRRFKWTRYADR